MRTISREVARPFVHTASQTLQRLHAELLATSVSGTRAYLFGASRDATLSRSHGTIRFGQADQRWLDVLGVLLERLGHRSWRYREGRDRSFWILETSNRWLEGGLQLTTAEEKAAFARGYFDAEGGIPRHADARFYVQFVQKDREDLGELRKALVELGIECGRLHQPSARVDPGLWRFYVRSASHAAFALRVGSWHPRKRCLLVERFNPLDEDQDEDIVRAPWRRGE